jgi:hypothetical protein
MSCNKPFTRKNLVDMLGLHFVNHKMKQRRQDILFDLEKSLLPASQERASNVRKVRELANKRRCYVEQRDLILIEISDLIRENTSTFYNARKNLKMLWHDHSEEIQIIDDKTAFLQNRLDRVSHIKNVNIITVKCPDESCRGFVDCKKCVCTLCEIKICKECHEPLKGEGHECKQEVIESIKLIMSDTRNCPSCKALIHKIEGCDQMFCTMCQTPFSWRTGEIVRGSRIHNPHYYEYLARTGGGVAREIEDIPCGGLPQWRAITAKALCMKIPLDRIIPRIHMAMTHIEYIEMPRYRVNDVEANIDLRVLYLNNEISLDDFKREIYKREKAVEKKREIQTILGTLLTVGVDIFTSDDYSDIFEKFECIRKISNEAAADISKVYGCVVPHIDEEWEYKTKRIFSVNEVR